MDIFFYLKVTYSDKRSIKTNVFFFFLHQNELVGTPKPLSC